MNVGENQRLEDSMHRHWTPSLRASMFRKLFLLYNLDRNSGFCENYQCALKETGFPSITTHNPSNLQGSI
jgi:hypothetical protein